jgi:hypothetical protein
MIAVGVVVMFLGLCVLPAALQHPEGNLLGLGACVFAMGALIIAGGIYLHARGLQRKNGSAPTAEQSPSPARRVRGGCDLCQAEAAVIQCKVHELHLCGACLARHYDFRSCSYVPTTRKSPSKAGKGMASRAYSA